MTTGTTENRARRVAAALVALLVVACVACSSSGSTATGSDSAAAVTATDSAAATDAAPSSDDTTAATDISDDPSFTEDTVSAASDDPTMTDASGTAPDCGRSLDRCYRRSQMKQYYELTINDFITPWIQSEYQQAVPPPSAYVFIPDGDETDSACGTLDDETYAYCPGDNKVYVGQAFQWYLYNKFGAIGPAVALAHEYGHHLQTTHFVPEAPQETPQQVNEEDQADCVAGAFVNWADSQGIVEYPKDLENVAALMTAISDAESTMQTHGTSSQRTKSFSAGFGSGLGQCNTFFPNTPIRP